MPTPPTDDPLASSGRAVGVYGYLDHATNALKRDALLFDQIAIPYLDINVVSGFDELDWLRDIGIVRDIPPLSFGVDDDRQYLAAIVAETGKSVDIMAIPYVGTEIVRRIQDVYKTAGSSAAEAIYSRLHSITLRRDGVNAFPILPTRRQIRDVFPSGTAPVLEVVLKSMPIPDDQTAWEDIIEFRNDPASMKRLKALRVWTRKFAKDTTATSLAEMKEEIEVLLDEYEAHMKLHRMKVNKGATETLLTIAGKVTEDFVKLKWGELAKLPFILRERKISLLEAEANAPNKELAYISIARSRFSR